MNVCWIFFKKELLEYKRTYKIVILVATCLLFGMLSPLVAKLTPMLLESFMAEGISIDMPEPVAFDSWVQFFNNMSQIGCVVLVLLFSGSIVHEVTGGTLIPILTKGMSRKTVICAKYTATAVLWTGGYMISVLTCWIYTVYVFGAVDAKKLSQSLLVFWLFGLFLLAILILFGTIARSIYGALLLTGGGVIILVMANMIPNIKRYNPVTLASENMAILKGETLIADITPAIIISFFAIIGSLILTCGIFQKKQL